MDSEKLINLFRAYTKGDNDTFYSVAMDAIEDEKKKKHHLLAKRLEDILRKNSTSFKINGSRNIAPIPRDNEKGFRLFDIEKPYLNLNDVILSSRTESQVKQIVAELKESTLLATYGLVPKTKVLFYGPPGTGKSLCARVLSSIIGYPLLIVRFDAVISSFLGETASNLRKVFDYIANGNCVVLFDEFDIIGKHRDDSAEHGEIKRVVSNFMMMLESYQGDNLIIAATNHPQLLDIAVWRRFQDVVYFDLPDKQRRRKIFNKYLRVMKKDNNFDIDEILNKTKKYSGSDIEQVCIESLKTTILLGKDILSLKILSDTILAKNKELRATR